MDEIVFAEIDEIPLVMNSIAHLDIHSSSSGIVNDDSDDTFDNHPKTDINSTTIESSSHNTTTTTTRTGLRKRSSSADSLLHKTRNRKIERPQKRVVSPMTDSQIKNFYININKKVKLKPNLLETIFEQDDEDDESSSLDSESGKKKYISIKKFKRLLTLHDGLNATKALKDKRKNLIKKHLGARKHPKKMPKETFMEYLRKLNEEQPDDEQAAT